MIHKNMCRIFISRILKHSRNSHHKICAHPIALRTVSSISQPINLILKLYHTYNIKKILLCDINMEMDFWWGCGGV